MKNIFWKKIRRKKSNDTQEGAVIMEAAIALPVFMFLMITLYSVIQVAFIQARMSLALDCAAKELAEYAHVFYATGMNESFSGTGGKSSELANKVSEFLTTVGGNLGSVDSELGQFVTKAGEAIAGDSLSDYGKQGIGEAAGMQMMKKNMISGFNDNADAFMKRNRIKNLDMTGSNFLETGSKKVFLRVNYDIELIKLFNLDFSFHLSSCAYTEAWGGE